MRKLYNLALCAGLGWAATVYVGLGYTGLAVACIVLSSYHYLLAMGVQRG
jgi:hypothetical protein